MSFIEVTSPIILSVSPEVPYKTTSARRYRGCAAVVLRAVLVGNDTLANNTGSTFWHFRWMRSISNVSPDFLNGLSLLQVILMEPQRSFDAEKKGLRNRPCRIKTAIRLVVVCGIHFVVGLRLSLSNK